MRALRIAVTLVNLLVAGCWAAAPHAIFLGTPGKEKMGPTPLEQNAIFFYVAAVAIALMTAIFWKPTRQRLWLPIGLYSFMSMFFALSQARAFTLSVKEGLILYAVTVLPPLFLGVSAFWMSRHLAKDAAPPI